MKLFQTIVSAADFREAGHAWRDRLFSDVVQTAQNQRADVILLPGGFWMADDAGALRSLIDQITRRMPVDIALIGGIDLTESRKKLAAKGRAGIDGHPYYGFAILPGGEPTLWQQTSVTSADARSVPKDRIPAGGRIIHSDGQSIATLICGELFSVPARQSFIELRPNLIVDLGHASMGTGVSRAMEKLARLGGSAVAHTQHVVRVTLSLHFVNARGHRESVAVNDCESLGDQDCWISWIIREF